MIADDFTKQESGASVIQLIRPKWLNKQWHDYWLVLNTVEMLI